MAKMLDSEEVFKGHFVIIYKNQLSGFLSKYFSSDLCIKIQKIVKMCFQWEADLVILFLNKSSGSFTCTCFMPIYFDKETLLQNAGKNLKEIEKCVALQPRYLRTIDRLPEGVIYSLIDLAFKFGYWQREYSFGVLSEEGENKMYRMNTVPFSEIKVKKETIDFEQEQLELYKCLVKENPQNKEFKEAQNILVRQITDHRKELDLANGFTQLQFDAYEYTLRMPDVIDRKFDAGRFEPFIELVDDFFRKIHKSLQNIYGLRIADAGAGSAVLFIDLIPQNLDKESEKNWTKGKEHLRKTVSAMPVLTEIGDVQERVNKFCKKAELDPEQAKEILKSAQRIFPKSIDKAGALEIYSQSEEKPIAKFDQDGHLNFHKAKKNLTDSLKPLEETIMSGFLGLIVGWESEDPRFVIETEEKRRITVKYDKEKTDEVKARFKKQVKFERIKEGRSWRLLGWK